MAPRTNLECPHKGPSVDTRIRRHGVSGAGEERHQNSCAVQNKPCGGLPPPEVDCRNRATRIITVPQRLVVYCRKTSASNAPCTSRRTCCRTHCAHHRSPLFHAQTQATLGSTHGGKALLEQWTLFSSDEDADPMALLRAAISPVVPTPLPPQNPNHKPDTYL